ncbi:flippase-like domain-containing protein [Geodermatophilus sp. YIM 151500]|uniref:lysylphosphatidylglycerol synthase transmembrane domain-containing protein n=1 Tax=Geodermatophilus sp. YIM 151500 TaxID=2984531 RepID=UPI0021E3E174|nr:lysylphosphatidylglycerol synthase transmembrane domain-containing protein [Geodermatophilus sp. YIM 151500]MCV2489277.1 flippase-like domain-containing protein [Geodermatophilus sp. YIM 151500]
MGTAVWGWARRLAGVVIIAVVVWRVGTGPFVEGIRRIDAASLLAAGGITTVTTVCAAWRWRTVVAGLGVDLPLRTAVAACYRSQFLNSALPGGVVGDVHRGVRHGRDEGDVGRGLRAVFWERAAGQVVFVLLALGVLLVLDSPVRSWLGWAVAAALAALAGAALAARALPRARRPRWARLVRAVRADVREGLLARRAWPVVVATSVVVAAGHATTFLVAARTTGAAAPPARLVPLAVLVMLAMALPLSIGGWGPREGAAAWVFGAAGLGAAAGVAAATAYGVIAFAATLPGALVLAGEWLGRRSAVGRVRAAFGPPDGPPGSGPVPSPVGAVEP